MDRRMISAAKRLSRKSALRFARDEDGHVVVFTAIMATLMLMLAGVGIDIINFETVRTKQQQTLDRATLAAASLTQELDAESVVRDYFAKADMTDHLRLVQFQRTFNASTVRAEAEIELTPIFMNLYDLSDSTKLVARGASQAEQRINNIEIMLVLDVSGSMAGTKLTNLKSAASEFIDTVMSQDIENRVSIGIVPYNGQVNLPQYLQTMFTSQDDHLVDYVNCFDLPGSTYGSLTLSRTTPMPVTAHADTYSTTSTGYIAPTHSSAVVDIGNRWCPPSQVNVIRAPTNDRTALKNHINGLTAIGATSINAGLKWGAALLDPSARSLYTGMVSAGQTPSYFGNRPFEYDDREAMKIIVLMTDGEHFAEERMNSGFRVGTSPIWRATSGGLYSVFHQARVNTSSSSNICNSRPFYVPHLNAWHSRPWNGTTPSTSTCYSTTATYTGATQQRWQDLWASVRVSWAAQQFYVRPLGVTQTNQMNTMRTQTPINNMNTQLQQVCTLAKAREVMVYGIAFEAPTNGRTQIEQCASSPAHYFNAQGLEISTAFRSIATNISQLKLTQ
ncbi:TadE/TadG family type IV pilus assembly protein [Pseudotabrizicola sp. 4114]|uniref:TadE/TadG family type IV pilus assembly protein n=1 Tax=Pseudotabrizicola sp. 4114 TaxID=2817731 RepID=UPI002866688B|nr:Flp pilus assembly protein TadG [Pseudorhodobacter sp. 4114]